MIIGVDPGGRETGIVLRDGDRLVRATLVRSDGDRRRYLAEVLDAIGDLGPETLAVEGINPPNPHLGVISVAGIIQTAIVLGAILGCYPAAHEVEPGGHGAAPLAAYPPLLVGPREKLGTGRYRHLRSAWDIAGACSTVERSTNKGARPCK